MLPLDQHDEQKIAAALWQIEHDILEAVASGQSLQTAMTSLCQRIETLTPEVICSILSVDEDNCVHPIAAPSLPEAYIGPLDGVAIGPAVGSCGTAAYRGEPLK